MSRADLIGRLNQLYDVVEVNNIGAVPLPVAVETIRLINPNITHEQAEVIAADCDSRGKQQLTREDLNRAALTCLQNTDVADAIGLIRDLTTRMRVAFRRRYLMYDAPANSPPPSLLENSKTVAMYRELFDLSSRDSDGMSRRELHRLMHTVLPEYTVDATNAVKAALSDQDTDHIFFYEFMMVVQPCTSRRCLSDMLAIARRELIKESAGEDFESLATGTPAREASRASNAKMALGSRPTKTATDRLRQELLSYQMHESFADQRAAHTLSSRVALPTVPDIPAPPAAPKVLADEELERENTKLRIDNEDLRRQNATLAAELSNFEQQNRTLVANSTNRGRSQSRANSSVYHLDRSDDADPSDRVRMLEEELRQARARLAISTETNELCSLLRRGENAHTVVRNFYPDESVFIGKHQYLQDAVKPFMDGVSPICTIIGQYDLIVVGYQALYRQLRAKSDTAKSQSTFDPMEAARSIVPKQPLHATPSRRGSPSKARASPMRWKDLDRAPTADMRGTGTLADPLLTDEERHTLRAKLAAQMRGSARFYANPTAQHCYSQVPSDSYRHHAVETGISRTLTSQEAMHRLQNITGRAVRQRHLD
jgi:hypothetical protein